MSSQPSKHKSERTPRTTAVSGKLSAQAEKPDKKPSSVSERRSPTTSARLAAQKPAPPPPPPEELPTADDLMDVESMSDEDLMKLCQDGDEGAFAVLFSRYESQALSFIHRLIGDRSRTEALGQEAFLRIFKDAKSYQYPRSFTTWFYTIVRNLCKNELRWRSRHPTVSIEENLGHSDRGGSERSSRIGDLLRAESTDPLEAMVTDERNRKLEDALMELPELEREILILNRFQGLKYREISEIVGVPVGTVRVRIYSALEALRKSIKDYF